MSNVTICDWCKKPFDDNQLRPVTFPSNTSMPGSGAESSSDESFDLCTKCNEQVISRLRSRDVQLFAVNVNPTMGLEEYVDDDGYDFVEESGASRRNKRRQQPKKADVWPEDRGDKIAAIERGDVPVRDGEEKSAARSRSSGGRVFKDSKSAEHAGDKRKCPHMNKGRIAGIQTGRPWRQCLDCNKKIPIKRPDEKGLTRPPAGVNLVSSNDRRR